MVHEPLSERPHLRAAHDSIESLIPGLGVRVRETGEASRYHRTVAEGPMPVDGDTVGAVCGVATRGSVLLLDSVERVRHRTVPAAEERLRPAAAAHTTHEGARQAVEDRHIAPATAVNPSEVVVVLVY